MSQSDWDTYAANIDTQWQLCANCTVPLTGKKLYRQYNLNRQLLGLSDVDSPIDNTETAQIEGFDALYYRGPDLIPYVLWEANNGGADAYLLGQKNLGMANPMVAIPPGSSGPSTITNGPVFDFVQAMIAGEPLTFFTPPDTYYFQACQFTDDGAPGLQIRIAIAIQWYP